MTCETKLSLIAYVTKYPYEYINSKNFFTKKRHKNTAYIIDTFWDDNLLENITPIGDDTTTPKDNTITTGKTIIPIESDLTNDTGVSNKLHTFQPIIFE